MSWSSWLLLVVLAALTYHYPWLVELAAAGAAGVLQQPVLLVLIAAFTALYKARRRGWV